MKKEEYNYFDEFIKDSNCIIESAQILNETLKDYNLEKLEENIQNVHKLENEADNILHEMMGYLIRDFLPPIDREDITTIIRGLDDIEDNIDEILINFNILNIISINEDVLKLSNLLIECCECVKVAFVRFKNFKKDNSFKEKTLEINKIEEKADKVYEDIMKKLYTTSSDSIEIIKWTNIYNCIENTIDMCEHISDCIIDVVMKNS